MTKEIPESKFKRRNLFVYFSTLALIICSAFKSVNLQFTINGYAQGTTYRVNYYDKSETVSKHQIDSILSRVDSSMSVYKSYSLISRFNNSNAGVQMDEHLAAVISKSFEISRKSKGAFDITVYPLVSAWGFGPDKTRELPGAERIKSILKNVGYHYLEVKDHKLIKKKPDVKIDVNGIAQDYSVDIIAGFLEARGIHNYMVELGGELRINGRKLFPEI